MSSEPRIRVSEASWEELNKLREYGESYDDVIQRLLGDDEVALNER